IESSWRSTRISSSFARAPHPTSTINSSSRQTTTYKAETSKSDLQQSGTPDATAPHSTRAAGSGFCTTPPTGPETQGLQVDLLPSRSPAAPVFNPGRATVSTSSGRRTSVPFGTSAAALLKLVEAAQSEKDVADDQQCPALADDLERAVGQFWPS